MIWKNCNRVNFYFTNRGRRHKCKRFNGFSEEKRQKVCTKVKTTNIRYSDTVFVWIEKNSNLIPCLITGLYLAT